MSLISMTGYGHGESRIDGTKVEVEVSSVNRKQFDLQLHMPRALQVLESRIQDEVSRVLSRGRITMNVFLVAGAGGTRRVRADEGLARAYVESLRAMAAQLGLPDKLDSRVLAQLPDLLVVEHPEEDLDVIWPVLQQALGQALAALVRMRRTEGRALQADLEKRFQRVGRWVAAIAKRAPAVVRRYREGLHARLQEAGVGADQHAERIAREIALFADRTDICEEITRLGIHLEQAAALIRAKEPAGRSLDFLAQEMFREINTIGSKANDAVISADVVKFKAELERIREQVQNVE